MNKLSPDFNIPFWVSSLTILLIGGFTEYVADVTELKQVYWGGVGIFFLLAILYGRDGGVKSIFFSVICFVILLHFCRLAL